MADNITRLQIEVDSNALANADAILARVGLTPSALINSLLSRIAATGSIPFDLTPTRDERIMTKLAAQSLTNANGKIFTSETDINEFWPDPDPDELEDDTTHSTK